MTLEQFEQNILTVLSWKEGDEYEVCENNRGYQFFDKRRYGSLQVLMGGFIYYNPSRGYSYDHKGVGEKLTLEEVGKFYETRGGQGTIQGSYKPKPILKKK